jgi:hypothetical protein
MDKHWKQWCSNLYTALSSVLDTATVTFQVLEKVNR